jgi:hypothetical protein
MSMSSSVVHLRSTSSTSRGFARDS